MAWIELLLVMLKGSHSCCLISADRYDDIRTISLLEYIS